MKYNGFHYAGKNFLDDIEISRVQMIACKYLDNVEIL